MPVKKRDLYQTTPNSNPVKKRKCNHPVIEETSTTRRKRLHQHCKKTSHLKRRLRNILSPFRSFRPNVIMLEEKKKVKSPYRGFFKCTGLSPKEKSYIICNCQTRSARYLKLKHLATNAIKANKIFTVYGSCNAVRAALLNRGWVEKIPPTRMNLSKVRNGHFSTKAEIDNELEKLLLSNLVEKYPSNFIWRTQEDNRDTTIDMSISNGKTIFNKLKIDATWTTKQGLCCSMKRNYWFYIEDVAEVTGPRTYNTFESGEIEAFINDYKITACTSLLKWILSMVANDRPVFLNSGKISLKVVIFALNRCKEYLFCKQNKDIDKRINNVSSSQWNAFLKNYYRVIARDEVFQADIENKLPFYLGYAKFLLKEIHKYRPQLSCEGCHDIWIIKPAHCSRGRGIRLASKLGVITNMINRTNAKYVIQKYIEEPLLIYETKFDVRQYYLVTSTYPLIIWMYKDCYLKFSSQKYNLKNYDEAIHLTNNAVQKKYKNCTERHSDLPPYNMWDLDRFKEYLNKYGKENLWDDVIYPGMKKSIIGVMLTSQDTLSSSKNSFELYGCDFILDKEFKPWLIEINSCPDLNHTTPVTARICPDVVSDIIKVVIDYAYDPSSSTGNFECIYRQTMTAPRLSGFSNLVVRGHMLPNEYFYKGNININRSFDDFNIGDENDTTAITQKIKNFHDVDIMIEPDDDCIAKDVTDKESNSKCKDLEDEYDEAVSIITEQLDNIILNYNAPDNLKIQNIEKKTLRYSVREAKPFNFIQSNDQLQKFNIEQSFNFSRLDDGPTGKSSFIELNPIQKLFYDMSSKLGIDKDMLDKSKSNRTFDHKFVTSHNFKNDILEATSNIIAFFNEKEKHLLTTNAQ